MVEEIPTYEDLELRIERVADDSYRVDASACDRRTASSTFDRPITDDELDDFVGRAGQDTMKDITSLGSRLFNALIKDDVRAIYEVARAEAEARRRGLRISLLLSHAPELMRLPWEFLYSQPRFLSESADTPVVRRLDLKSKRRPLEVGFPLKILGMVSAPAGCVELDTDEECRRLENALSGLKGLVELEWLKRATLEELGRRVSDKDDIHVLHYIGHGGFDEATQGGILALENAQGRRDDVSGERLGRMLQDEKTLRLVVLNSCKGARTSHIDPFSGVATKLVQFDIPAVIAMQFDISDQAAVAFSTGFYKALAQGQPVDAALAPARREILGGPRDWEFATPVLFLHAADAQLFDLSRASAPSAPTPPTSGGNHRDLSADQEWADALSAYSAKQWPAAIERFEALRARYPGEAKVDENLHQARRERDIVDCSRRADAAAAGGDWDTAVTALEKLTAIDPTYPDTRERLEHARIAQRRAQLVNRWRRPILVLAMLVAAVAALGVVLSITQRQPKPLTTTQIDAMVTDSLVYLELTATGYLAVPEYVEGAEPIERRMGPLNATFVCSGFVVDPSGAIATAEACVNPNALWARHHIREDFITQLSLRGDVDATDLQSSAEWNVYAEEVGWSPPPLEVKVIQANGVISDVTDNVVRDFSGNALVKVPGLPLKPLVIAHQAPQPGRALTAVGYPPDGRDPHRLPQPRFKTGTASRQEPSEEEAPKTEIDADNSRKTGGPTVDNETGEVLGINVESDMGGPNLWFWYLHITDPQAFYITDAPTLRNFLQRNGVHLEKLAAPNEFSPWVWFLVGAAVLIGVLAFLIGVLSLLAGRKKGRPQRGQAGPRPS